MLSKVLKTVLSESKFKTWSRIIGLSYTLIYLYITQFIIFSSNTGLSFKLLNNWSELLIRQRSAFLFEAIAILNLGNVTLFISPLNILLAIILSTLVSLNLVLSFYMFKKLGLKGAKGMVTLVGTIPALLGGAACCVPTLIVVLGLQFTATLSTIWPWFVPLSLILLIISLLWVSKQIADRLNL